MRKKWQFWIDRGGTFTDLLAIDPDQKIYVRKVLSKNDALYEDAAIFGMRQILDLNEDDPFPAGEIDSIRMGTTVATNALLERKGAKTLFAVTAGFEDLLTIRDQRRPDLFAKHIIKHSPLYHAAIGIDERLNADGMVLRPIDLKHARTSLADYYTRGFRSIAIAFLHSYKNPAHEIELAHVAREIGYTDIATSSAISPSVKIVPRGETTVAHAFLNPILQDYVSSVQKAVGSAPLYFMQSNGGLIQAEEFLARDAILSGPAGGIVGAVETAKAAGFDKIIGFDMGGTSTDVSHCSGTLERTDSTMISGIALNVPMMDIHTVAAGGGSICSFENGLYRVGPESAGAEPGPACYGKGGPLTITDCNLIIGKLQPQLMPQSFGKNGDQMLDHDAAILSAEKLSAQIKAETGKSITIEKMAHGFLEVANEHMVRAIKKISVERGLDTRNHCLVSFGGAGGQHATDLAEILELNHVYLHPLAGILSAVGIGLARTRIIRKKTIEISLNECSENFLNDAFVALQREACAPISADSRISDAKIGVARRILVRYEGTDVPITLNFDRLDAIEAQFENNHLQLFGFSETGRTLIIDTIEVEAIGPQNSDLREAISPRTNPIPLKILPYFDGRKWSDIPFHHIDTLKRGTCIEGPAVIYTKTGTNFFGKTWSASIQSDASIVLTRRENAQRAYRFADTPSPILLEIFKNRFMSIAEQMGAALERTAHSVNIKERLDFSCAIFDHDAQLVANAPHMPVHLGSMSESVKAVADKYHSALKAGDAVMLNDPYHGGTHLPDITVVMPVFIDEGDQPDFFIASRGHHADIGGITPGSMPPFSQTIDEEGVLIDRVMLVKDGQFQTQIIRDLFANCRHPARNIDQNIADLKAQVSACQKGIGALKQMNKDFGLETVKRYMQLIQENAAAAIRSVVSKTRNSSLHYPLDNGAHIYVACTLDQNKETLTLDFTGTSPSDPSNFNAPRAITTAAILYVFRLLANADIPLNAGCLKPLNIIVPEDCLLNPKPPAAVVSGNVETSQALTNALLLATNTMAASQGTMNNLTFGNQHYQYYETIAGGSGAGDGFNGASAIQTHMTNSKMTDPEILELRYPVLLEKFAVRKGSGGRGRWNGGDGVIRRIRFLEEMETSIISSCRDHPPSGLAGGEPGQAGINRIIRNNGNVEILHYADTCYVHVGDQIEIETPGGGGFGPIKS